MAECLLTGLVNDTLGFRTSNTTVKTLAIAQQAGHVAQQLAAVDAPVARVAVGKMAADVAQRGRAEDRVRAALDLGPDALQLLLRLTAVLPQLRLGLAAVLAVAAILRFWALGTGLPHSPAVDEPEVIPPVVATPDGPS